MKSMKNKYSLSEFFSTAWSLLLTKISLSQARLVRRPVYIRGGSSITGAQQLTTGHGCRFDLPGNKKTLCIGDNCELGDYCHIVALNEVTIGNEVLVASKVFISDTNHGMYSGEIQDSPMTKPNDRPLTSSTVHIGNRVWIGENAVILAGSYIGDGCIIGANSVVKGEWSQDTILAGSPAKAIKKYSSETEKWVAII